MLILTSNPGGLFVHLYYPMEVKNRFERKDSIFFIKICLVAIGAEPSPLRSLTRFGKKG